MCDRWTRLAGDRRGATAVEYGLVLSVIVIVMLVALHDFADAVITIWNDVATRVTRA